MWGEGEGEVEEAERRSSSDAGDCNGGLFGGETTELQATTTAWRSDLATQYRWTKCLFI